MTKKKDVPVVGTSDQRGSSPAGIGALTPEERKTFNETQSQHAPGSHSATITLTDPNAAKDAPHVVVEEHGSTIKMSDTSATGEGHQAVIVESGDHQAERKAEQAAKVDSKDETAAVKAAKANAKK